MQENDDSCKCVPKHSPTFKWRSSCQCVCVLACSRVCVCVCVCVAKQRDEKGKCDVIGTCGRQKELNFQYSGWMQPISAGLLCVMALVPLGAKFCRKNNPAGASIPLLPLDAYINTHLLAQRHKNTHKHRRGAKRKERCPLWGRQVSLMPRVDRIDCPVRLMCACLWTYFLEHDCVTISLTSYKIWLCHKFYTWITTSGKMCVSQGSVIFVQDAEFLLHCMPECFFSFPHSLVLCQ